MFDDEYVQRLTAQHRRRSLWQPSDMYLLATLPERAAQRAWMDTAATRLARPQALRMRARLEKNRSFLPAMNELALFAILTGTDTFPAYEERFGKFEPDVTLHDEAGNPTAIVELQTKFRPQPHTDNERRWIELARRVERIAIPVVVFVDTPTGAPPKPPTAGDAKRVERELRAWLPRVSTVIGRSIVIGANRYTVAARALPGSLRTHLRYPYDSSTYTSYDVLDAIYGKERRYASAAYEAGIPYAIVLAGEPACPIDLDLVRAAVKGTVSISFSFDPLNINSSATVSNVQMKSHDEVEHFDPGVSAVGWLQPGVDDPGTLTLFLLRDAAHRFPMPNGPNVVIESQ